MTNKTKRIAESAIQITELNKWFGDFHALKNINLSIENSERVVICGPSGSGKSTLIRCVNALERHNSGDIKLFGVSIEDYQKNNSNSLSEIGMVFQQFNLFPHLTILQNLTLGPTKSRGMSKPDAEKLAMQYLERVKIPDQAHKRPSELSGGQQQRVAIARSLLSLIHI